MLRAITLVAVIIALSACVSTRARHGYIIERGETELTAEQGLDSRESVLARYGEPTLRPAMNDNTWYYVTMTTNARAFFRTQTTNRQVVAFNFDNEGSVTAVESYALADGMNINLVDRETPTRGKQLTFIEQLVGSVGQLPPTQGPQVPGQDQR